MAPLKRKRPPHDPEPTEEATPVVTRRATRQTSIAPLPIQPDPEPRRRRGLRADNTAASAAAESTRPGRAANGPSPSSQPPPPLPLHARRRATQQPRHPARQQADEQQPAKTTRSTRHSNTNGVTAPTSPGYENMVRSSPAGAVQAMGNGVQTRPARTPIISPINNNAAHTIQPRGPIAKPAKQYTSTKPELLQQQQPAPPRQAPEPEKPGLRTDRNIDKVVLGNICFRAWYPSYYGKEVLGDVSGNSGKANGANGTKGGTQENGGGKVPHRKDRDSQPILDRLYVCPCCFKYSKELVTWWEHVRVCERRCFVPGEKIYVHPKGRRVVQRVIAPEVRPGRKKRGDSGIRTVEEVIEDHGEWSIWEVDGEKEGLFCQNLSLFAKLFLDNKSVFFDVTGFNYFLLVYTPPASNPDSGVNASIAVPPRPQIVGFFSKEKMSWDNNNLACILVFPPWQRKGLGALLMGVSYEISRREGILGGPEKPISDLGKKGYKRFWAGEVARWLLSLDLSGGERLVDIEECSKATWIVPEDCLLVLREMGVVEDAGLGPPKGKPPADEGEEEAETKEVSRVKISREAVRTWVKAHHVNLDQACDPNGFIEGYAIKQGTPEEDEV